MYGVYIYIHICVYIYTNIFIHHHVYQRSSYKTHIHTIMNSCVYICIYTRYTFVCCICIYTYHTHIHTCRRHFQKWWLQHPPMEESESSGVRLRDSMLWPKRDQWIYRHSQHTCMLYITLATCGFWFRDFFCTRSSGFPWMGLTFT